MIPNRPIDKHDLVVKKPMRAPLGKLIGTFTRRNSELWKGKR